MQYGALFDNLSSYGLVSIMQMQVSLFIVTAMTQWSRYIDIHMLPSII